MAKTQIEAGINIGVVSAKVTKEFDAPKLPEIFTIHEAASAAVSLSKDNPLPTTYDEALRGLLSATLNGFFKGVLLYEQTQPVEVEKDITELAKLAKENNLSEPQRVEALHKIRGAYAELKKDDDLSTVSDDRLLEIFSNPDFLWLGLCTDGETINDELRPKEYVPIEDSFFISLLYYYVSQSQKLIDKDNLPKTFAELNAKYPNEMKQFKKILPSFFNLPNNFDGMGLEEQPNIFIEEFKKMKISKKHFKEWYKQFLNQKFN